MGRAGFVIASAMVAFVVGSVEFVGFGFHREWKQWDKTWGEAELSLYLSLVLAAMVAAAISALVFTRDHHFHGLSPSSQTFRICLVAYILFFPLLMATGILFPSAAFYGGAALVWAHVIVLSIIPVLALEYMVVDMARRLRSV